MAFVCFGGLDKGCFETKMIMAPGGDDYCSGCLVDCVARQGGVVLK